MNSREMEMGLPVLEVVLCIYIYTNKRTLRVRNTKSVAKGNLYGFRFFIRFLKSLRNVYSQKAVFKKEQQCRQRRCNHVGIFCQPSSFLYCFYKVSSELILVPSPMQFVRNLQIQNNYPVICQLYFVTGNFLEKDSKIQYV